MDEQTQTTTPPPSHQPGPDAGPRVGTEEMRDLGRLRRSSTDRYLGGVAGGLARHFDVDPTIVRVAFVVFTFFGAGLLLYVAIWLFVPTDGARRAPLRTNPRHQGAIVLVAAALTLLITIGGAFDNSWWGGFPVVLTFAVLVALFLAIRDRRDAERGTASPPYPTAPQEGPTMSSTTQAPGASTPHDPTTAHVPPVGPPTPPVPPYGGYQPPAYPPAPARPRRTGLLLFWPTLALVAIALGTLGVVDVGYDLPAGLYAAVALGITGLALVLGAFRGRPGGLIALGLVGTMALAGTSAVDAAAGADVTRSDRTVVPTTAASVEDLYDEPNGRFTLDLSRVQDVAALDDRQVDVAIRAGELHVVLPEGLTATVDAEIHYAGEIDVEGATREGLNPTFTTGVGDASGSRPTLDLHLTARVGQITVERD